MEPQNTRNTQKEFLFKEESYAIRGAVFEVYREMNNSFSVHSVWSVVRKRGSKQ